MYEFSTLLRSTISVTSIKYHEEADKDSKWGSYKKSTFKCGLTAYQTIERVEWRPGTQTRSQIEVIRVLWIWRSWWNLQQELLTCCTTKAALISPLVFEFLPSRSSLIINVNWKSICTCLDCECNPWRLIGEKSYFLSSTFPQKNYASSNTNLIKGQIWKFIY